MGTDDLPQLELEDSGIDQLSLAYKDKMLQDSSQFQEGMLEWASPCEQKRLRR